MKTYATAAAVAMLMAAPALAQTTNSPSVDANGVSVTDQTLPLSERTKDINSPYNAADPRNKNHVKGAAGGAGKPSSGLAAGGGGPASKPPTKIQTK
jgi:hypothetical protein